MPFAFQAAEFFFFAVLIGAVTILFAIMSFFYKYVSLQSDRNQVVTDPKDESTALISNDAKQTPDGHTSEPHENDKGNESEF